jgi:hypothetical protein
VLVSLLFLKKEGNPCKSPNPVVSLRKKTKNGMQMMEQEPLYPVGVQIFEKIRRSGAVYVDKTDLIYKLTHRYEMVFLSRPRRFGKSLLVDTLACYFEAQKELFTGLAMESLEKEWTKYPVIRFNFGDVKGFDMYELRRTIEQQLEECEKLYGTDPKDETPATRFNGLIKRAYEQTGQPVVILIDEYDAPLLEVLMMPEKLDEVRNYMRNFYSRIKTNSRYIRFAFMTGISTFSQLGMFSELNNLKNITNDNEYASICGITLPELEESFAFGIRKFAEQEGCTFEEMVRKLREQYDGYHFTKSMVDVFNPYSLLNAFSDCDLNNYWFQTGTPSFAISMLKAHKGEWEFNIEDVEKTDLVSLSEFNTPLEQATKVLPFLYQAGYLTIKEYYKDCDMYVLGVPNMEVRVGLLKNLIPLYSAMDGDKAFNTAKLVSVALNKGDYEGALLRMQSFLSGIPFLPGDKEVLGDELKCEAYYHKVFYIIVAMLNNGARGQVRQALGVPDIVIETRKYIYVIELKINSTPQVALRQLEEMNYALPFAMDGRELVKLGVNFSTEKRTIDAWERGE